MLLQLSSVAASRVHSGIFLCMEMQMVISGAIREDAEDKMPSILRQDDSG